MYLSEVCSYTEVLGSLTCQYTKYKMDFLSNLREGCEQSHFLLSYHAFRYFEKCSDRLPITLGKS